MEKLTDKLADKTLELFSKQLSEGVEVPGPGAAAAYTAALGISLGMRACAPAPDKTREALEAMRGYCMRQAVEDGKMLRPLLKLMSEPESERTASTLRPRFVSPASRREEWYTPSSPSRCSPLSPPTPAGRW